MNTVLKIILSQSLSGSLLILILLLSKPLLKNRTGKQWQYYIWLVAIARLLLPFTPEASLVGTLFQKLEQPAAQMESGLLPEERAELAGRSEIGGFSYQEDDLPLPAAFSIQDKLAEASQYFWMAWLGAALLLLIRKVTIYQSFVKYIRAGRIEVSEIGLLDRFAQIEEQMGVKRPVELYTNGLIASPLLLGFFRPCIVLPAAGLPDTDFKYTIRHELTHYKRRDMFYKWLVQAAVCLHWFNPLVWLMEREISRSCELACDEAVIRTLGPEERRAYGDTLLRAMGLGGSYRSSLSSVTLNQNAELLKERLGAIMDFKGNAKLTPVVSFVLTGALITGAAAAGAYPVFSKAEPEAAGKNSTHILQSTAGKSLAEQAERYYEAGSLPLFQIVFSQLSEKEQSAWLDRIYADGKIAFFSVSVNQLDARSPLLTDFAEKLYEDGAAAFFSVLADCMSVEQLENWLDRALNGKNTMFQVMLLNKLDMDDELDALEKELEEKRLDEYRTVGVARNGKNYYYEGQLVNIFLDHQPDSSFYLLDMNPAGTVNVKIVRDKDGRIKGAAYMTEEERKELFGRDLEGTDIPVDIASVKNGEYVWLGTYTLDEGDQIYYSISAETGKQLDVGFARPGQKTPDPKYYQVSCQRTGEELEIDSGPMIWEPPVKPGEYSLFVHAEGGALTNVKGCVCIVKADTDAAQ